MPKAQPALLRQPTYEPRFSCRPPEIEFLTELDTGLRAMRKTFDEGW